LPGQEACISRLPALVVDDAFGCADAVVEIADAAAATTFEVDLVAKSRASRRAACDARAKVRMSSIGLMFVA